MGAVSGQGRGWVRPVVETEGPQAEGSGRSGAGSCPQSITRQNEKMKKLKSKNKEKQAPGPPPDLFWVRLLFWQNDWGRSQEQGTSNLFF